MVVPFVKPMSVKVNDTILHDATRLRTGASCIDRFLHLYYFPFGNGLKN